MDNKTPEDTELMFWAKVGIFGYAVFFANYIAAYIPLHRNWGIFSFDIEKIEFNPLSLVSIAASSLSQISISTLFLTAAMFVLVGVITVGLMYLRTILKINNENFLYVSAIAAALIVHTYFVAEQERKDCKADYAISSTYDFTNLKNLPYENYRRLNRGIRKSSLNLCHPERTFAVLQSGYTEAQFKYFLDNYYDYLDPGL